MTTRTAHSGASSIPQRQNDDEFVSARAAARAAYSAVGRIRFLRTTGTVGLAVAAPLVSVLWPSTTGITASVAAVWLVAGRTLMKNWERSWQEKGRKFQEYYDSRLFRIDWNTALAGRMDAVREEMAACRPRGDSPRDRDWYESVPAIPWPYDVLACQMQNALWGRRNHRAYANLLWGLFAATCVAVALVGALKHLELEDLLLKLFLPVAPALVDLSELPREHRGAEQAKEKTGDTIADLRDQCEAGRPVTAEDCREIQDAIYHLRGTNPAVPSWFHRRLRRKVTAANEAAMRTLKEQIEAMAARHSTRPQQQP
jgi:hypothetical protein